MPATSENPDALASYRFARGAAIILAILIAIALGALVLGFAFRSPHTSVSAPTPGEVHRVALPEGARILEMDVVSGRIVLHVHSNGGDEVDIIDSASGELVGQVKAGTAPRSGK